MREIEREIERGEKVMSVRCVVNEFSQILLHRATANFTEAFNLVPFFTISFFS